MAQYILLIDDLGRVESSLAKILSGVALSIEPFSSPREAKRRIIETSPLLIISLCTFQNELDGGFRLSQEISEHGELSKIPVMLITEQLTEEIIARASKCGARALMPWPVSFDSFRNRLKPFIPALNESRVQAPSVSSPPVSQNPPTVAGTAHLPGEKIQLAQQLLAKVLHNLKTSALLEVVDVEDIPRVVLEITRALCAVSDTKPVEKSEGKIVPTPVSPKKEGKTNLSSEVSMDLDAAFGRKK